MIAFKATYKDMSSHFGDCPVYEVGKTYKVNLAARGLTGFHAAEDPIFCLNFIRPEEGRYFKVELGGRLDPDGPKSTAASATMITFLEEMTVEQMLWYSMKHRLDWSKPPQKENAYKEREAVITTGKNQKVSATANRSVAIADHEGSTATASGYNSLAIAEKPGCTARATGSGSLAVAFGPGTSAEKSPGAWAIHINPDAPAGKQVILL